MNKEYSACIYARLSRDDGDKLESDSIINQRALIRDYLKKHPEIHIVSEKTDDGFSGVNFDRPAFKEMMDEIRSGKVNCVVVKDLSRFGRNYIEAGNYIEKVFPFMGVRFIAINDSYDSLDRNQADSLIIPFKNLINDAYCKDISVKIRSQLEIKRKNGEYIGAFVVYGYLKDPENKNKIIVDPFASEVVRAIFKWKIEGMSQSRIADKLNAQGVLCPLEYKRSIGVNLKSSFQVCAFSLTFVWQFSPFSRIQCLAFSGMFSYFENVVPHLLGCRMSLRFQMHPGKQAQDSLCLDGAVGHKIYVVVILRCFFVTGCAVFQRELMQFFHECVEVHGRIVVCADPLLSSSGVHSFERLTHRPDLQSTQALNGFSDAFHDFFISFCVFHDFPPICVFHNCLR